MTLVDGPGEPGLGDDLDAEEGRGPRWGAQEVADAVGFVLLLAVLSTLGDALSTGLSQYSSGQSANVAFWGALFVITTWANGLTGILLLAALGLVVVPRWLSNEGSDEVPGRAWALLLALAIVALLGTASVVLEAISRFKVGPGWGYVGEEVTVALMMVCALVLALAKLSTWPRRLSGDDLDEEEYSEEDDAAPTPLDE